MKKVRYLGSTWRYRDNRQQVSAPQKKKNSKRKVWQVWQVNARPAVLLLLLLHHCHTFESTYFFRNSWVCFSLPPFSVHVLQRVLLALADASTLGLSIYWSFLVLTMHSHLKGTTVNGFQHVGNYNAPRSSFRVQPGPTTPHGCWKHLCSSIYTFALIPSFAVIYMYRSLEQDPGAFNEDLPKLNLQ